LKGLKGLKFEEFEGFEEFERFGVLTENYGAWTAIIKNNKVVIHKVSHRRLQFIGKEIHELNDIDLNDLFSKINHKNNIYN
jgi:hypothetical protein